MMVASKKELPFDSGAFLANLRAGKIDLTYRANTEIFAQGSPSDAVYFLVKGMVKIVRTTPAGREAVLIIHGPNSIFGDGFLSGRLQRGVTATAIEDTSVIRVEAAAMRLLLHEQPQFSEFYIGYLVDRKIRTEFSLADQLTYSSEQRLAIALLQITDVGEGEAPRTVGVKISQEALADMVGTTRSRISFFMNKFRRAGFIEYKGHLRVHRDRLSTVLDDRRVANSTTAQN